MADGAVQSSQIDRLIASAVRIDEYRIPGNPERVTVGFENSRVNVALA